MDYAARESARRRGPPGLAWLIGRAGEPVGARVGRAVPLLALLLLLVFGADEFKLARARQAGSDLSPGLRIEAEAYQAPDGCPPRSAWAEGDRFSEACLDGYRIQREHAYAHGLTPPTGGRRVRQTWFRAGDDAVLAYCGLVVGCKATLVVRGRFAVPAGD